MSTFDQGTPANPTSLGKREADLKPKVGEQPEPVPTTDTKDAAYLGVPDESLLKAGNGPKVGEQPEPVPTTDTKAADHLGVPDENLLKAGNGPKVREQPEQASATKTKDADRLGVPDESLLRAGNGLKVREQPEQASATKTKDADRFGPTAANLATAGTGEQLSIPDYEQLFIHELEHHIDAKTPTQTGNWPRLGRQSSFDNVVGRLVNLSYTLAETERSQHLYRQAYLAARAARGDPWRVKAILSDLENSTARGSRVSAVMFGLGLSVLFLVFTPLFVLALVKGFTAVDINPSVAIHPLVISALFGVLGGAVSLMSRISVFEDAKRRSWRFLTISGFILPVVGSVFAIVAGAIFASGMISFNFAGSSIAPGAPGSMPPAINNAYFYVVVGFLAGFSERFMQGLLGRVEDTLSTVERQEQVVDPKGNVAISSEVRKIEATSG